VLSTTWRLDNAMRDFLLQALQGMQIHAHDTPDLGSAGRGVEVAEWLQDHPEVEQWVILDDGHRESFLQEGFTRRFVQTTMFFGEDRREEGLTTEKADEAIRILLGMQAAPLVVGISGAPRSGKSSTAEGLAKVLGGMHGLRVRMFQQDACNSEEMQEEIQNAISSNDYDWLLIEGSQALLNREIVRHMCALLWLEIGDRVCRERRVSTTAVSKSDSDIIAEEQLWSRHIEDKKVVMWGTAGSRITVIDGEQPQETVLRQTMGVVYKAGGLAEGAVG